MNNRIFLKCRFLSVTNTRNNRVKIIQSNTNDYIVFDISESSMTLLEFCKDIIKQCDSVNDVSILVDNTQSKEYLLLVQEHDNNYSFSDIILELKDIKKRINA